MPKNPELRLIEESNNHSENWPPRQEILAFSPQELANYFSELEENGDLERFLEMAAEDKSLVAMFSYWEKWLKNEQSNILDEIIAQKREIYGNNSDGLPLSLEKIFAEDELKIIFANLGAIQLTFGCSKGCPFCGYDAVPGVREHILYSALVNLFKKFGKFLGPGYNRSYGVPLYYASEPGDYFSQDKTFQDVFELALHYSGCSPAVISRETDDPRWIEFLNSKEGDSYLSVFGFDNKRVAEIENRIEETKIRLRGKFAKHVPGVGVSNRDDKYNKYASGLGGIGPFEGVILTPRGLYNVVQLPVSREFPQGQIIAPIEELSDTEIFEGDFLKDVLRHGVVELWMSGKGVGGEPYRTIMSFGFVNANGLYGIAYNAQGVVVKVDKFLFSKEEVSKNIEKRYHG